jgi:hypothetical protein
MVTAFGQLGERPTLIVEVLDDAGNRGWGSMVELPAVGRRAPARLPYVGRSRRCSRGNALNDPRTRGRRLDRTFGVQAIQAGEEGTLASVAAMHLPNIGRFGSRNRSARPSRFERGQISRHERRFRSQPARTSAASSPSRRSSAADSSSMSNRMSGSGAA